MSDLTIESAHYAGDKMPWAEYVIAGNIVFLSGAAPCSPTSASTARNMLIEIEAIAYKP